MFLRSAAMTVTATMGAAVFAAGLATGVGLGMAGVGAACLARKAMQRRRDWKDEAEPEAPTSFTPPEAEPLPM